MPTKDIYYHQTFINLACNLAVSIAFPSLFSAHFSLLKWVTQIMLQKKEITWRKLVNNFKILANNFGDKYFQVKVYSRYFYYTDSWLMWWLLKSSLLFTFGSVNGGINWERYWRFNCIHQSSWFKSYIIQNLKAYLKYRGDSSRHCRTLKLVQNLKTDGKKIVDPALNKLLLSKKARLMDVALKKQSLNN